MIKYLQQMLQEAELFVHYFGREILRYEKDIRSSQRGQKE